MGNTQSRVVRDATLKRTEQATETHRGIVRDIHQRGRANRKQLFRYVDDCFRAAQRHGLAIGTFTSNNTKALKCQAGYGYWWSMDKFLYAVFPLMRIERGEGIEMAAASLIRVSHHAIERIAERLDTLDPDVIRRELSPAVMAALWAPYPHSTMWTPSGHAVFRGDDPELGPQIVTWIDGHKGRAWPELSSGWTVTMDRAPMPHDAVEYQ